MSQKHRYCYQCTRTYITSRGCKYVMLRVLGRSEHHHRPPCYGLQIENPSTGYIVIHMSTTFWAFQTESLMHDDRVALVDWDSYEIHKVFANHPSFPTNHQAFKPSLGSNDMMSNSRHQPLPSKNPSQRLSCYPWRHQRIATSSLTSWPKFPKRAKRYSSLNEHAEMRASILL